MLSGDGGAEPKFRADQSRFPERRDDINVGVSPQAPQTCRTLQDRSGKSAKRRRIERSARQSQSIQDGH
jgi:hypothetical protein